MLQLSKNQVWRGGLVLSKLREVAGSSIQTRRIVYFYLVNLTFAQKLTKLGIAVIRTRNLLLEDGNVLPLHCMGQTVN
jgi:hypothetical protein